MQASKWNQHDYMRHNTQLMWNPRLLEFRISLISSSYSTLDNILEHNMQYVKWFENYEAILYVNIINKIFLSEEKEAGSL